MPKSHDEAAFLRALGRAIRSARKSQSISQEDLALKVRIDRTYVSGIERGLRKPSVHLLLRLAWGLDLQISSLFAEAEADL